MKKIIEFIKKHWDKVLHFGVNFVMALTAFWSWQFAVGICIGLSVGKEYGDSKASGNKWSWADIIADMLGMGFGLLVVYIVRR